ncbi:MAG: hypothetical protein MJZ37_10040 [Bacilli bacterium]|nr:hypothetical protein [Bacilli bacterium]
MLYTFTEKELKCFLDWAWPAECEIGLTEFEVELRDKLRKILWKTFDEMSNSEKIDNFLMTYDYHSFSSDGEYYYLRKDGKEEKLIPYEMDYKDAMKEIVKYYED